VEPAIIQTYLIDRYGGLSLTVILNPSPGLSVVTAELSAVVRQRRAVIQMKKYLRLCRLASSDRLLRY
jgi:hypothetical protein